MMLRIYQPVLSHASRENGSMNISIGRLHLSMKIAGSISGQMATMRVFDSRKIVNSYWTFMIFLLNIGRVSEPEIRLNPPLALFCIEPEEPRVVSTVMICCT